MTTKRKEIQKTTSKSRHNLTPWEEMDRLFDTMFSRQWLQPFHGMFPQWPFVGEQEFEMRMPRIDVLDRDDELLVRAELPGVEKDRLDIDLSGEALTIRGETSRKGEEREGEYYRSEITEGKFSRTVRLPEEVDGEHIKAEFKDGMLEVYLPKARSVERHKIEVD